MGEHDLYQKKEVLSSSECVIAMKFVYSVSEMDLVSFFCFIFLCLSLIFVNKCWYAGLCGRNALTPNSLHEMIPQFTRTGPRALD
jgi:hypothetical protein